MGYLTNDSIGKKIPPELGNFVLSELRSISKEAQVEIGISTTKEKILEQAKSMTSQEIINRMKIDSNFSRIILDK